MLKALHRLNPANKGDSFNETKDCPRPRLSRDRRKAGGTLKDVVPISATFALEAEDLKVLGPMFDDMSFPASTRAKAWRTYGDELGVDLVCDFRDAVEVACREAGVEDEDIETLAEGVDQAAVIALAEELSKTLSAGNEPARAKAVDRVPATILKYAKLTTEVLLPEQASALIGQLPRSEHLKSLGRTGLDPRISIIPVGGIGNMPAFVALMGRRLDVRALVDGAETARVTEKVRSAAKAVNIAPERIVVIGEMDGLPATADIEDLFTVKDYLWLYSRSVGPITEADLPATPEPILRRLMMARARKRQEETFDHALPAQAELCQVRSIDVA